MKLILFTIFLLLFSLQPIYGANEGRIYIQIKDNKASLEKIYEKKIESKNIYISQAFLENKLIDITQNIKKHIEDKAEYINIEDEEEYCTKECLPNKYPHIRIYYVFNNPPEIFLISPRNEEVLDNNNISFKWYGRDKDGKLIEYAFILEQNGERIFQTPWIKKNNINLNLPAGKYSWQIFAQDNSKLNNVTTSEKYSFEIKDIELNNPKILSPQNHWETNLRSTTLIVETDKGVLNKIYLNNEEIYTTEKVRIEKELNFTQEGVNIIKVISENRGKKAEDSISILTDWTPPSNPIFTIKEENNDLYIKIYNTDYQTSHIYLDEVFILEKRQTNEYIKVLSDIEEKEYNLGVILEDRVGNKSRKIYQMYTPHGDILGHGSGTLKLSEIKTPKISVCRYKYNYSNKRFEGRRCNITPPRLIAMTHRTLDNKFFTKRILGIYNPRLKIIVDVYVCTSKRRCNEKFIKSFSMTGRPYSVNVMYIDKKFSSRDEYKRYKNNFFQATINSKKNRAGSKVTTKTYFNSWIKFDQAQDIIEIYSPRSNSLNINKPVKVQAKKKAPFRFPFNKNIGVTQWYGYTAFQSPHKGIDFGSYKEPIYAIGNGHIRNVGWDNYLGECFSGGYFARIEHDNGLSSIYFHLDNYRKANGQNWRPGERILEGQLLGLSSNTGAYNCQPMGHHLHLELWKGASQSTHTDPVPLINVNWDSIPTLQHQRFPGRLTGNNPHPTW